MLHEERPFYKPFLYLFFKEIIIWDIVQTLCLQHAKGSSPYDQTSQKSNEQFVSNAKFIKSHKSLYI